MPEYRYNPGFSDREWYQASFTSVSDFSTVANGKHISPNTNLAAVYDGKDITEKLRQIGLTDHQIFETFGDCKADYENTSISCALSDEQKAKIDTLLGGAIADPKYWVAPWEIAESAYWEQTFPAGKEIEVTHEYQPLVGTTRSPRIDQDGCPDEGSGKTIERRINAANNTAGFQGYTKEVEYILGTGRNWKGPILKFRLLIEKSSPDEILSLCFPGKAEKLSPTEIEFSQTNYTPQDRLIVYFVKVER